MRSAFPRHPVLVAAFPVLFLFAHNVHQAQIRDMALPLAVTLALSGLLWGALTTVLKSFSAAGLVASWTLLLFFSYGHALSLAGHLVVGNFFLGRNRYFLPVWALALIAGSLFILRARGRPILEGATRFANVFSTLLVFMSLFYIARYQAGRTWAGEPEASAGPPAQVRRGEEPPLIPAIFSDSSSSLPDIYYIIPDSYEANSSLKEFFGYDNSVFTRFLEEKGFVVASRSTANYGFTMPSLASSLNMEMINGLQDRMGRESTDMAPLADLIADNKVMAFLKSKGYTVVNAGSWWGPTFKNRNADINLKASGFNEFAIKLMESTVMGPFIAAFTAEDLRAKTLFTLENIGKVPDIPGPTFTLAHVICPHPPYVFGPNGESVSRFRRLLPESYTRSQYLDQLIFMNMKLEEVVGKILSQSQTPPIIIIQGDHGAAYTRGGPVHVDAMPNESFTREQMRIFNAFHLPGLDRKTIPDSVTPVNTFRIIFNAYFGTDFPMLENRNFYSNRIRPYAFVDVTAMVE